MILINLLPYRELARKRQQRWFLMQLGGCVLLAGLTCVAVFVVYQHALDRQHARNQLLQQAIAQLDQDLREMADLEKKTAALRVRREAFEQLQAERNLPVQLLQELALQLPDGVSLSSLQQDRQDVVLTGLADSQERVSALLHNLGSSDWLSRPELVELVAHPGLLAAPAVGQPQQARPPASFTVRVTQGSAPAHRMPASTSPGG